MSRMLWLVVSLTSSQAIADGQFFSLETFDSHSRLSFSIPREIQAQLKNTPEGVRIELRGLTLHALGAPFGQEKAWLSKLTLPKDLRVQGLELTEEDQGVVLRGRWKFPTGDLALAVPRMEVFQFRDPDSRKYVVDFWVGQGMTQAEALLRSAQAKKNRSLQQAEDRAKKREAVRLARYQAQAEASKDLTFCEEPVNEENEVFLPFFPEHKELDVSHWFPGTTADLDYPYRKPEGDADDARAMRLALELYQQGKTALAVRSVEFLEEGTPQSTWLQEARFLKANALLRLGHEAPALALLHQITLEGKGMPVALYSRIFLAVSAFKRKEYLAALEQWNSLIRDHGDHSKRWIFHFVVAESLYRLRQAGPAEKAYRQVIENAPDQHFQAMAAFRIGDVHLDRQNFAQAAAAYFQAAEMFGGRADQFPEVYLNRGEALYGLADYKLAEREFSRFLKRFPAYPAGWKATLRMAEIRGREKGPASQKLAREGYLETINRYPLTPGALLARMRLIPCGDHGGFTPAGAKRLYTDSAQVQGFDAVVMNRFTDFRVLSELRSLVGFGRADEAIERAVPAFQKEISTDAKRLAEPMLRRAFRNQILRLISKGDGYGALAFYERLSPLLVLQPGQIPADFFLALAQAADQLEISTLALKHLGEVERLDLNPLDAPTVAILRARAKWRLEGRAAEKDIVAELKKVPDDSGFAFDRETLLGEVTGNPAHFEQALLIRKDDRLARRVAEAGKQVPALLPFDQDLGRATRLEEQNRWSEAVTLYDSLIKKESSNRLSYLQARAREHLPEPAQKAEALKQYQQIVEKGPDDFWKKLAQEALAERQRSPKGDENQGG